MNKFIGAFMVAIVCTYFGFSQSDRLKKRKDFLAAFLNALSFLETEICFGRYDLKSIFKRIDDKKLFGLYTDCAEYISKLGIKKAWKNSVNSVSGYLKPSDADAVLSLAAELGMSDVEGQKNAIKRTSQLITQCADNAEEEYARLGRVYRSCGVLAGIFVMIIFV